MAALDPYVPRFIRHGLPDLGVAQVAGTFVSADISGFTRVSERLEGFGREGAEIMGLALDERFGVLVDTLQVRGGDVLFFGGDALFTWFSGPSHEWRAARAAVDLQRHVKRARALVVPGGSVRLHMSIGIHTGTATAVIGGTRQRSFFLIGPAVDRTLALEAAAQPGQILTSAVTARALDENSIVRHGRVVQVTARLHEPPPAEYNTARSNLGVATFVAPTLRPLLATDSAPREHRLITVTFARLGALARAGAAERIERVQQWCHDLDEVTDETGTILLATDVRQGAAKATIVAGVPTQSDRDDERAVAAAHELVKRNPSVAAGVNTGAAFVGDVGHASRRTYMILGDSVNTAARAMGAARLGEALITERVAHTASHTATGPRRRVRAKGKRDPIILMAVTGTVATRPSGTPSVFVGRARELKMLLRAVEATDGRIVEVIGDGGLGRTRLLDELQALSLRKHLRIDAPTSVGGAPFAPIHMAMRSLCRVERHRDLDLLGPYLPADLRDGLPLMGPLLGFTNAASDLERRSPEVSLAVRVAILTTLTRDSPAALLVDDLDALDSASHTLIRALAPNLAEHGWSVAVTRRPGSRALASGSQTVRLRPLPAKAIRRIVLSRFEMPIPEHDLRRIVAHAHGNPLFAVELTEADSSGGLADLPRSAERLAGALVDTMPVASRTLLRHAAALGDGAEVDVLAHVLDDQSVNMAERWEPLHRFVSVTEDSRLSFTNETIRAAAYEGLPFGDRRRVHARAVDVLERRMHKGETVDASAIARHAERAALPEATARWAPIAAREAESVGATEEAASLWGLALNVCAELGWTSRQLAAVAESCGDANELLGDPLKALTCYRRAARGAEPVDVARLAWKSGRVELREGNLHTARRAADRGLRALRLAVNEDPHPLTVRLVLLRAAVHFFTDRRGPSLRDGTSAMAMARALRDEQLIADAAIHLEMEYSERGDPLQSEFGSLAVDLLEPGGPTVELGSVLGSLGLARMFVGDWAEALALYGRAARTFELCGHVVGRLSTEINRLSIFVEQGHLDLALETIDDLMPAATSAPKWFGHFLLATRGRALAFKGSPHEGAREIRAALRSLRVEAPRRIVADIECYLLEALVLAQKPDAALRVGRQLVPTLDQLAPDQVVTVTPRRLVAIAHQQNGSGNPSGELDAALAEARAIDAPIEVSRVIDAQGSILQLTGAPIPLAWKRERRKILADHQVIFEPTFPITTEPSPLTPVAP